MARLDLTLPILEDYPALQIQLADQKATNTRLNHQVTTLTESLLVLKQDNSTLTIQNAALNRRIEELYTHNEHLQTWEQTPVEKQLADALEKKKDLRAKTNALYAWNNRLHGQVAMLRSQLRRGHPLIGEDSKEALHSVQEIGLGGPRRPPHVYRRTDLELDDPPMPEGHMLLFKPSIPMTPIVAAGESLYVTPGSTADQNWRHIQPGALAGDDNGEAHIPCEVVINPTFVPTLAGKEDTMLTYVGFKYPDGTSLSYIPIRGVRIEYRHDVGRAHRVRRGDKSWTICYGRTFVHVRLPSSVYQGIVGRASRAMGRTCQTVEEVNHHDGFVSVDAGMKSRCTVQMKSGEGHERMSVARALRERQGDVTGDAMLYVRFTNRTDEAQPVPTMYLRFHSLIER